jgi:hypothetical protein
MKCTIDGSKTDNCRQRPGLAMREIQNNGRMNATTDRLRIDPASLASLPDGCDNRRLPQRAA